MNGTPETTTTSKEQETASHMHLVYTQKDDIISKTISLRKPLRDDCTALSLNGTRLVLIGSLIHHPEEIQKPDISGNNLTDLIPAVFPDSPTHQTTCCIALTQNEQPAQSIEPFYAILPDGRVFFTDNNSPEFTTSPIEQVGGERSDIKPRILLRWDVLCTIITNHGGKNPAEVAREKKENQ